MSALARISDERSILIQDHCFFGTLALYLKVIIDESFGTMATDGKRLFAAPTFIEQITDPELRGVIVHEILHCALKHHTRRGDRDPELWNMACDYVINPMVIKAGFTLPRGCLFDKRFAGMGAEEVYEILLQERHAQTAPQTAPDGAGGRAGQGAGGRVGGQNAPSATPPDGQGQAGRQGGGYGGSQGGQRPAPDRPSGSRQGTTYGSKGQVGQPWAIGGVLDAAPAYEPAALAEQEREWERIVRQAVSVAKAAGNVPGEFIEELVNALNTPKSDLYEELHRFVDSKTRVDYSFATPNKRMLYTGFIMPGLRPDGIGKLGVIIDTSGSIRSKVLDIFFGCLNTVMDVGAVGEVIIAQCDVKVHRVDRFYQGDIIKVEAHGRGGTRFAPALDWFAQNEPDVALLIYFTDLECTDFGQEPPVPLMWCVHGHKTRVEELIKRVPFGETARVEG